MKYLFTLIVLLILFSSVGYTQSGFEWQWLHPSPHGVTIRSVQRVAPSTWYLVGTTGLFQKTTDDGQTWDFHFHAGKYLSATNVYSHLYDFHFFDLNNGVAVGNAGSITKTTDGGNTWQEVTTNPAPSSVVLYAVHFVDNLTGFAVGGSGTLVKTTDGGNNWSLIPLNITNVSFDVWSHDGTLILVATSGGNIYRSTNGGSTWNQINFSSSSLIKIAGTIDNLYFAGTQGSVARSTDGGESWVSVSAGIPSNLGFVDVDVQGGVVYLTGPPDVFYKSTNNGSTWESISLIVPGFSFTTARQAMAVSPGGDSLFIVSSFGQIHTKLGNSTPVVANSKQSIETFASDIYVSPSGQFIMTVNSYDQLRAKNINRSTDGGLTWISDRIIPSSTEYLTSIDMVDSLNGFVTGSNSALFKTTDGGNNWGLVVTTGLPVGAKFDDVDFTSLTTGWLFAEQPGTTPGTVFKTTNGGSTWFNQPLGVQGVEPTATAADMVDSLRGWFTAGTQGIFSTTNGGNTWKKDSLAVNAPTAFYSIKMLNSETGYALSISGQILKTSNGGLLWDTLATDQTLSSHIYNTIELLNENTIVIFGENGYYDLSTDSGNSWVAGRVTSGNLPATSTFHRYDHATQSTVLYITCPIGFVLKTVTSLLPVELTSFSATPSGRDVILNWNTATELNNKGFEIERKKNRNDWETISFINGNGTTTNLSGYTFTDKNLVEGSYSYRIKQIDFDGTIWYSHSVEIEIGVPLTFGLSQNFPNPFNPTTVIRYELPVSGMVSLKVYNAMGEEVASLVNSIKEAGSHSITFDASKLASGIYFYSLKTGDFSSVKKMSLIK